jgi:uncharacterized protein
MATLDHPYHFDGSGRTALTGDADHIRDLIEQVLFTSPGERVMRPDFGAGLLAMVFEPNSVVAGGTAQFLLKGGLQRHLSHLIAVDDVAVENIDAAMQVTVRYTVLAEGRSQQASFALSGAAA